MEDWAVWPIFVIQCVALALFIFPKEAVFWGIRVRSVIIILLLMSCVAIGMSLYHDSTNILHLYF